MGKYGTKPYGAAAVSAIFTSNELSMQTQRRDQTRPAQLFGHLITDLNVSEPNAQVTGQTQVSSCFPYELVHIPDFLTRTPMLLCSI
jgi:hypothetical protein